MVGASSRVELVKRAWLDAAADLGIAVDVAELPSVPGAVAVVPGFGAPAGAVVAFVDDAPVGFEGAAKRHGLYWSKLGNSYLRYERELFIDTLNDWGWFGDGSPPDWYTGQPWTGGGEGGQSTSR